MKRKVAVLGVAIVVSFLSGFASAYQFVNGAFFPEDPVYYEQLSFDEGKPFNLQRREVHVPQAYGRLVAITANTFWFESSDGVIRNVILEAKQPVIIKRKGTL